MLRPPQSLSENSEGSCFRAKGWMARREEGDCSARERTTIFGESVLQGLGSPYPWWIFDRRATKPGSLLRENPPGGGSFACGLRWLGPGSPLWGWPSQGQQVSRPKETFASRNVVSDLAALAAAKIPRRRIPRNFQTGSYALRQPSTKSRYSQSSALMEMRLQCTSNW